MLEVLCIYPELHLEEGGCSPPRNDSTPDTHIAMMLIDQHIVTHHSLEHSAFSFCIELQGSDSGRASEVIHLCSGLGGEPLYVVACL